MLFEVKAQHFDGEVKVIYAPNFGDSRGFFNVEYRKDEFRELGLPTEYVQDNRSFSKKGTIRGLHFQYYPSMGKLMRVTHGRAWFVTVDIRRTSPTFLQWLGVEVSDENRLQIWAPSYFARGFAALTDVEVQYKCDSYYDVIGDRSIRWNDPFIGVRWPSGFEEPILSNRDATSMSIRDYLATRELPF